VEPVAEPVDDLDSEAAEPEQRDSEQQRVVDAGGGGGERLGRDSHHDGEDETGPGVLPGTSGRPPGSMLGVSAASRTDRDFLLSYVDFDIWLRHIPKTDRAPSRIAARAACDLAGEVTRIYSFDLRLCQEVAARVESSEATDPDVQRAGDQLGSLLLSTATDGGPSVRELFHTAYSSRDTDGLRIRLRCESELIRMLPWEFARITTASDEIAAPLVLDPSLSLVRHEEMARRLVVPRLGHELVIAFVNAGSAGGSNYAPLKPELPDIPRRFGSRWVDVVHVDPNRQSLEHELRAGSRVDVFHFSGHGEPTGLVLNYADQDGTDKLTGAQLAAFLERTGVQLAVLSACHSSSALSADGGGVAHALVESGVPIVVAMQHKVGAVHAMAFVETFYEVLFSGATVDEAVTRARLRLVKFGFDYGRPVLYHRSSRGAFLTPEDPSTSAGSDRDDVDPSADDRALASSPVRDESNGNFENGRVRRRAAAWSQAGAAERTWRIVAGPRGPAMVALQDAGEPLAFAMDGVGLAVSPDGRAVVQWAGNVCTAARIISRTGRLSPQWRRSPAVDEAELLAMTIADTDQIEMILSTALRTYQVRLDGRMTVLVEQPSRAAVYLDATTPCTVDPNGRIRDDVLRRRLPTMAEVTGLDAAISGGRTLVAASGLAPNGRPVLATASEEGPAVRILDDIASGVVVERQLDPNRRPHRVATVSGTAVLTHVVARVGEG